MPLTETERRKVEQLFNQFDTGKKGYIDEKAAKGSGKMLILVKSLQRNATKNADGKIYLDDLIEYYENFKSEQSSRDQKRGESICDRFVTRTMKRVKAYKQRASYGTLNVPMISKC